MIRAMRLLLSTALVVAGLVVVSGAGPASAATTARLTATPAAPVRAETFTVTYRISTHVKRSVSLQRYSGSKWVTVSTRKTSSTGRASFSTRTTASKVSLRVRASRVKRSGKTYRAHTSATRRVRTVAQSATIRLGESGSGALTASATALPARAGRTITLQESFGGAAWRSIASGRQSSRGSVTFAVARAGALADGKSYRALVSSHRGASALTSLAVLFRPAPVTVKVPAPDLTATDSQGRVTLRADVTGPVARVRFFIDGRRVGQDDSTPPWSVPWSPERGDHDVIARAFGPTTTSLSASRQLTVSPTVIDDVKGLPQGFSLDTLQEGFDLPTSFAMASPGQVFVSQKAGTVMTFGMGEDGSYTLPRTVVDISDQVHQEEDRGMIGIAADPRSDDGHQWIYVSYIYRDPVDSEDGRLDEVQQVQRFDVSTWSGKDDEPLGYDEDNVVLGRVTGPACFAEAAIRTTDCLPLHGYSHTIGDLAFDPDGNLLVGVGDGSLFYTTDGLDGRTQSLRAQDKDVLAGKVLRINPDTGRGVPDNPFYSGSGTSNASRVLAFGFRNPFRMTVRDDGSVVVGDVGDAATEELDVIHPNSTGTRNYGWPCFEGEDRTDVSVSVGPTPDPSTFPWDTCRSLWDRGEDATVHPIHTYPHIDGGSVTGGAFYTGDAYPKEYRGAYFFGDYAQNFIRTALLDHDGEVSSVEPFAYRSAAGGPVKFAMGPDNTLWYLSIYSGSLRRVVYDGSSQTESCKAGTFRQSYFDLSGQDSSLRKTDADYEPGWGWVRYAEATFPSDPVATAGCTPDISLAETTSPVATGVPADRFGVRWQGRLALDAGTYEFAIKGRTWVRVFVDDVKLHEWFGWGMFDNQRESISLPAGIHNIRVELVADDGPASADITWKRVGAPPEAAITTPTNGTVLPGLLANGTQSGTLKYSVKTAAVDGSAALKSVTVLADLLHVTNDDLHAHPYTEKQFDVSGRTGGATGSFELKDSHAPQHSVFRLRARVTDASGATTVSAATYVCLMGNAVGPCALK